MHFGGAMSFTDYSMSGWSLPARSRSAVSSRSGRRALAYPAFAQDAVSGRRRSAQAIHDAMDPFVVLAAAAQATKTIKLGTGVALIQQRDAIQTAKLVASIGQVSRDGSCLASAAAGTRTKWKTTAPSTRPASSGCAN